MRRAPALFFRLAAHTHSNHPPRRPPCMQQHSSSSSQATAQAEPLPKPAESALKRPPSLSKAVVGQGHGSTQRNGEVGGTGDGLENGGAAGRAAGMEAPSTPVANTDPPTTLTPTTTTTTTSPTVPRLPPTPKPSKSKHKHLTTHMSTYPWLLSSLPARRPRPTFWSALKEKHFLALGTARARKHLHHPTYDFPDQFNIDAAAVTQELLTLLGDPRTAGDEDRLRDVMVKQLANRFAAGYRSMQAKGQDVRYTLTGTPRVTVSGLHFHYGPYPPPEGYARQQWWQFIELVIPAEDAQFTSHPRQKEIMKHAEDDGVYFKIDTRVDLDLEFVVVDKTSGMPLIRDRRRRVELQFVSPHFTPWDEVFELDAEGEWLLRWKWRVSDVDWLVESGGDL